MAAAVALLTTLVVVTLGRTLNQLEASLTEAQRLAQNMSGPRRCRSDLSDAITSSPNGTSRPLPLVGAVTTPRVRPTAWSSDPADPGWSGVRCRRRPIDYGNYMLLLIYA
jgi:hypothetical protein